MLYFSELEGKKVFTIDNIKIGTLQDFIFLASKKPIITKIVVKNNKGEKEIISTEYLVKINSNIYIQKNYLLSQLEENELFILKNLLDKQIIDIKGNKVVRVNDVSLFYDKKEFFIAGVDVGILGIIRRIRFLANDNIYKFLSRFNIKPTSQFLSWADIQPLELLRGQVKLKKREEKLEKIRPEDLADYLEKMSVLEAKRILKILDLEKAAEVVNNLNINYQINLFKNFKPETAAKFLSLIDPDEAADVLLSLSSKRRAEIMNFFDENFKNKLEKLFSLSKNKIGQYVTTDYLTVFPKESVRQVIKKIKTLALDFSNLDYLYVVNNKQELVGVFSLFDMLIQDFDTPVYKFMTQNVIVVHLTTPEDIVIKKMFKYNLYGLPVVDDKKHILGIVTLDNLSSIILNKL